MSLRIPINWSTLRPTWVEFVYRYCKHQIMNQFRMQFCFDLGLQDWSFIKKKCTYRHERPWELSIRSKIPDISSGDPEFLEKRTTSQNIPKFSKISSWEFPFHLCYRNFRSFWLDGSLFGNSTILGFYGNYSRQFRYHFQARFECCGIFGPMERAPGRLWCKQRQCSYAYRHVYHYIIIRGRKL